MSFFSDKLINSSRKKDLLNYLSTTSSNIFLYGAGSFADCIMQWYCKPHGISIDKVLVDELYYKKNQNFHGVKVETISSLHHAKKPFILIIGMGGGERAINRIKLHCFNKLQDIIVLDASSIFWEEDDLTYNKVVENEAYSNLYSMLQDDKSKEILIAFINARITGDASYVTKFYSANQYFPSDLYSIKENEVIFDCGAFDGDTLNEFAQISKGKFKKYFAIEPEIDNIKRLQNRVIIEGLDNVVIIPKGVYVFQAILKLNGRGTVAYISQIGEGTNIDVTTIDNIREEFRVKCTLIKMDIEGVELRALLGAQQTIINDKPKLAINVCHRPDDLLTIPEFIKNINPCYQLYLRHHSAEFSAEMVLYALLPAHIEKLY